MRENAGTDCRSFGKHARNTRTAVRCFLLPRRVLFALFLFLSATGLPAMDSPSVFATRAETAFDRARAQYESDSNNPVAAWQFARTCYDWADWATNKTRRAAIAREGITACRRALLFTNSAPCHYYLAMDYGQLAQAEMLHGLRLVREMEHEFKVAAGLDSQFDFAGPARGLGLLYRDAPGWPISIGSRAKARKFLQQAAALAPNYPENILNLAESEFKWGDLTDAQKEANVLDTLWPKAKTKLAGTAWEKSWADWTKRRDALEQKLGNS